MIPCYLCPPFKAQGIVAEWLGSALQKLLQRFESARYLRQKHPAVYPAGFLVKHFFTAAQPSSVAGVSEGL